MRAKQICLQGPRHWQQESARLRAGVDYEALGCFEGARVLLPIGIFLWAAIALLWLI